MYELAESWYDARSICQKNGGYLVTFNSDVEHYYIWSHLKKYTLNSLLGNTYWHFGYYTDSSGEGHWVNDEPITFTAWYDSNIPPNKCSGVDLTPEWGYEGVWFTYDCWLKAFFVCETPAS